MNTNLNEYLLMSQKELEKEALNLVRRFVDEVEDSLDAIGSGGEFDIIGPIGTLSKLMFTLDGTVSDLELQFLQNISTKIGIESATKEELENYFNLDDEQLVTILKYVKTFSSFVKGSEKYIAQYLFIIGIYDGEFSEIEKSVCEYFSDEFNFEDYIGKGIK